MKKLFHLFTLSLLTFGMAGCFIITSTPNSSNSTQSNNANSNYDNSSGIDKDGSVIGYFTIGNGKTARFARGNLQYQPSTNKWRFAPHQWDYIGVGNTSNSGWIDMFGYGTSGYQYKIPYMKSTNNNDYYHGDLVNSRYLWSRDNVIENAPFNVYTILSQEDWAFLLYHRKDANKLYSIGKVNGVAGLILLPDNFQPISGLMFTPNAKELSLNSYTTSQWYQLQNSGAVFLPNAGFRIGNSVKEIGVKGHYWLGTYIQDGKAAGIDVSKEGIYNSSSCNLFDGRTVRLVIITNG